MYDALPVLLSVADALKQLLDMQISPDAPEQAPTDANSALGLLHAHASSGHVSPRFQDAEVAKEAPTGMTPDSKRPSGSTCSDAVVASADSVVC